MNEKDLTILDKIVIQANPLIEAKKYMNVTEMRLFVLGLQGVKPHISDDFGYEYDVEFKETIIPTNQLIGLLGQTYGSISNLKKQLEKAYDSKITLNYKNGGFEFKHIYDIMKYEPEQGLVIKFDNKMKPYILEIVGQQYTKYKVKALFTLSSAYAWRILELLFTKQGYFKKGYQQVYIEYEIGKLREILNVGENMYKKTTDFRMYVLDRPIKEINEKTDYFVWYRTEKAGRRINKFTIFMKLKKADDDEKDNADQPPQLTSSAVDVANEPIEPTNSAGVTLLKSLGINPPSSAETTKKEKPAEAPAPALAVAETKITPTKPTEKNKNQNIGGVGERLNPELTEEQQTDYDNLLKIEVWAEAAKKIITTYDHARIERNYIGVMQDQKKGTIANLPAVVRKAIENDNYKGVVEEKRKLFEREQASKKAKYEKAQQAEAEKEAQRAKEQTELKEMEKIRGKYTPEELNRVMAELKPIYQQQNNVMSDDIINHLKQYGITHNKFIRYTKNMFSFK